MAAPGGVDQDIGERREHCLKLQKKLLEQRSLIIAANRGPVTFRYTEDRKLEYQRGGGGLVTALLGLAKHVEATWIASASTQADAEWREGLITLGGEEETLRVNFITPDPKAYDQYYNVIANPLLWFLQHNMWNISMAPTIDLSVWRAWDDGYAAVNRMFAEAVAEQVRRNRKNTLIMFQDYQLYLAPRYLREIISPHNGERFTMTHFVHIPWPGPEDWGFLPAGMRRSILEGLCSVDLLGFQTREDGLNFIRTCESHLPRCDVNFTHGRVYYEGHSTYVKDFPISIDVEAVKRVAGSEEVDEYYQQFKELAKEHQLIVRIDRTEPSKNIVRGFQAFDQLLELYPEYRGKVIFLAVLAPSRLDVEEYKQYLDETMAAAGRVNAKHGTSLWEPVRVLVGENYARAIAAMKLYDVLLVNSIADGMNLVAKEGPIVNERNGTVILSERTGARQQLEAGAIVISPLDIYATAEALNQALNTPMEEREERAVRLRWKIQKEDISDWLCRQLETIEELNL